MRPYYEQDGIVIYQGDCRDVLPCLNTAQAVVCDPPYGLSFMGKGWDHAVPGIEFWTAVCDSMSPGAHLLACGGARTSHRLTCAIEDAGFEIRDSLQWIYGSGFPKSLNLPGGLGTALKPAHEPIVMARKPFSGTVAANVLTHGTGALNIDACRIDSDQRPTYGPHTRRESSAELGDGAKRDGGVTDLGRWPANVLLDEDAALALDEQTGELGLSAGVGRASSGGNIYGGGKGIVGRPKRHEPIGFGDFGGASRFYYVAKASRRERGDGNDHPTVKPIALMRYLVQLITPSDGLVLDPFMGSGSTLIAAKHEGRMAIGIEIEERYCEIAANRLAHGALELFGEATA